MALYFDLSENKKHFIINRNLSDNYEIEEFAKLISRKDDKYYHDPRYKAGMWNGYISFFRNDKIATGLWSEATDIAKMMRIPIYFNGIDQIINRNLDVNKLNEFLDDIILQIDNIEDYRYYQRDAIKLLLQYRYANSEVATSGGKTLVAYSLYQYLKHYEKIIDENNKFLIIVPRVSLVTQTMDKFLIDYKTNYDIKLAIMGSKKKSKPEEVEKADIIISTYQSLSRKKKPFFSKIKVILVDEAHTSINNTITTSINKCDNLEYKFGLSGTLKINTRFANYLKLQSAIGPIVHRVPAKELIDYGVSADVMVKMIKLKYYPDNYDYYKQLTILYNKATESMKNNEIISIKPFNSIDELITTIYTLEKQLIYSYENRLLFIQQLILQIQKNALILFYDIKNGYGKRIQEAINNVNIPAYYIDGETKDKIRQEHIENFEKSNHSVIVASYGTFSTGIDLQNVHYIILAESYKSEKLIRQSIGRGMRLNKNVEKNNIVIIDLIDFFGKYSKKQSYARKHIYLDQKYNIELLEKPI